MKNCQFLLHICQDVADPQLNVPIPPHKIINTYSLLYRDLNKVDKQPTQKLGPAWEGYQSYQLDKKVRKLFPFTPRRQIWGEQL